MCVDVCSDVCVDMRGHVCRRVLTCVDMCLGMRVDIYRIGSILIKTFQRDKPGRSRTLHKSSACNKRAKQCTSLWGLHAINNNNNNDMIII